MRIGYDATPAVVQSAGVGRYSRELLKALVSLPHRDKYLLAAAASADRGKALLDDLPPGAWRELRRLPARAGVMAAAWHRLHVPFKVDRFIGDVDLFHATDFVLPPTSRPGVVTIHDLSFLVCPEYSEPSLVRYLSHAVPATLKRAAAIITVSATVAAEVVDRFPSTRDRIFAIPNGVAVPDSLPSKTNSDRPRVLIVGTIEPRKNHLAVIEAMRLVWRSHPDAELVIAGREGWQSAQIIAEIAQAGTEGMVYWMRAPSDAELEELYASADIAVYPSHYEGFGLPVLEAMARNVPVVVSDVPSLRETGGDAARYAPPNDCAALAEVILDLLDSVSSREDLVRRGQSRVKRFSWDAAAQQTHRAYRFAVESSA